MSSEDDLRKKLRDSGIPVGGPWGQTHAKSARSPFLERQRGTLQKLEGLLERQIEEDQKTIAGLGASLARLKRGGGV